MIENIEQLRVAFEKWASDDGLWPQAIRRGGGDGYILSRTNDNWVSWKACFDAMKAKS